MITLYSIGFTQKTAETFFGLLKDNVKKLVDVRAKNNSQLAGFTKAENLGYFCKEILGIDYAEYPDLAPSLQLMQQWKSRSISYEEYKASYLSELENRHILDKYKASDFDGCCFLCSEASPEPCHRRILAEFLRDHSTDAVTIKHLI